MNKTLTSFNTLFLILLSLSIIFSVFSVPHLEVSKSETIRINFFEVKQVEISETKNINLQLKKNDFESKISFKDKKSNSFSNIPKKQKVVINRSDIKNEISKIKLTKEREAIIKITKIIQDRISSVWIKPNSLSEILSAKVSINLAPSGEVLKFELVEPSKNRSFNDSVLIAMSKIIFLEEVLDLDRKIFESNFRNFKLVFKSSGEVM
tara:strand:- start:905 stop:1528 length:624 start_codon:yes stop_codon:yes gene_type:complete